MELGNVKITSFKEKQKFALSFLKEFVERVATPKSVDDSDEAWTQSVRRRFIEICPEDFYVYPNDFLTSKGEFLVNYTWVERDKGNRVYLAAESAWGTGRYGRTHWSVVEQSFEKLLAIKAPFKVLIYSSCCKLRKPDLRPEVDFTFEHARENLENSLKNYRHQIPGEVYIFIDFPQTGVKDGKGTYRAFIGIVKNYGEIDFESKGEVEINLNRPTEYEAQWA
jgi:hypothetical protein